MDAAERTVLGIYEHAEKLAEYPELGYRYEKSNRDVRILLYGHYRIVYLIADDRKIVILGVFHGALNLDRYEL